MNETPSNIADFRASIRSLSEQSNISQKVEYLEKMSLNFDMFENKMNEFGAEVRTIEQTIRHFIEDFKTLRNDMFEINSNAGEIARANPELQDKLNEFRIKSKEFIDSHDKLKEVFQKGRREFYAQNFTKIVNSFRALKKAIDEF